MSSEITNTKLQQRVEELEAELERYQAVEVMQKYDIDNLRRKLGRAETDISELEQSKKDLLIARNKSENTISRLRSHIGQSEKKLQRLVERDRIKSENNQRAQQQQARISVLTKENIALKKTIQSLTSELAAKQDALNKKIPHRQQKVNPFIEPLNTRLPLKSRAQTAFQLPHLKPIVRPSSESSTSSKRRLSRASGSIEIPPSKKPKIMNLLNPHNFPPGTTMGPFGVVTTFKHGRRIYLDRTRNALTGASHWTTKIPNKPQTWVMKEYPDAVHLPRMNSTQRRQLEKQALQQLTLADLQGILQENSLKFGGPKMVLVKRMTEHLNALYEEGTPGGKDQGK